MAPHKLHAPLRPTAGHRYPRAVAVPLPAPPATTWLRALLVALLTAGLACALSAQVAINTTGAPPAGNALLDLQSTTKGLLVPRMTATERTAIGMLPAMDGLLVYQTDSVGQTPKGFYYYDASTNPTGWKHVAWGPPVWRLGGNAGTVATDFLGTTNNMPLVFRTFNQERGRVTETGDLQLYFNAAMASSEKVHVEGAIKLTGGSVGNTEGTIRYTPGVGAAPGTFQGNVVNTAPAPSGWYTLENRIGERKKQETPKPGIGCQDPTNIAIASTSPGATPRPWPSPGPTTFLSLNGPMSPYWTVWEDGHRQYLYQASDLATAGICPGPSNPIRAIAFNVTSVSGSVGTIHFLRFRMKNTGAPTITAFDMVGLTDFAYPNPPNIPGPPPSYTPGHITGGYNVITGWNVHAWDQGGPGGFTWTGGNLLIDAALDDQEWNAPSINQGDIQGYNSLAQSSITMYCDACGNVGPGSCKYLSPAAGPVWYFPPTTPTNGQPLALGTNAGGWGWVGGWDLVGGVSTVLCDGTLPNWSGSGPPSIGNQLPRVAFLCKYTGGGTAYNVGNYMVAQDGVMIGTAAWASSGAYPANQFRGPGTISAQRSVWSNASLLSDYVFDLYYDGKAKPQDAQGASQYLRTPLQELPNYVARNRHLPTIEGRDQWNKQGAFSVDQLTNQLWVTVEDQALYIKELNERMDALQQFLVEKKLKALQEK